MDSRHCLQLITRSLPKVSLWEVRTARMADLHDGDQTILFVLRRHQPCGSSCWCTGWGSYSFAFRSDRWNLSVSTSPGLRQSSQLSAQKARHTLGS